MTNPQIKTETPMSMAELKETLAKVRKRDETLNFRAERTEEYLNQFPVLSQKEAKELTKKLEELQIPRLRSDHIMKLIDILPTDSEDVKTVLQGYTVTVTKENLKRISDAISESLNKKE